MLLPDSVVVAGNLATAGEMVRPEVGTPESELWGRGLGGWDPGLNFQVLGYLKGSLSPQLLPCLRQPHWI